MVIGNVENVRVHMAEKGDILFFSDLEVSLKIISGCVNVLDDRENVIATYNTDTPLSIKDINPNYFLEAGSMVVFQRTRSSF